MKTLKLWRTFKEGLNNFKRNGWLSFATVSIITLSLFISSLSFLLGVTTSLILQGLREKVSVNVSFNPDVSEEEILRIKGQLEGYTKEIASVQYVSRNQALDDFMAQSGNDPVVAQAIKEIGENPLLASLVVKAVQPSDYDTIVTSLQSSAYQNEISRINYAKNKKIFDRLETISRMTERVGLILGGAFVFIAILITFNTIRITIYSHRQEFEIMRLVGASNLYVRMPFVFEGALYGVVAAAVTTILLFGISYAISPLTQGAIPQGNFMGLYRQYFLVVFVGLVISGVFLGVVSSAIAIRRYLKA